MNMVYLLRALWKHRAASGVTIATLAVTVAVLLATIAVAHNFFVSPWPYDTSRLGVMSHRNIDSDQRSYGIRAVEYRALRDSGLFAHISASRTRAVTLAGLDGYPRRYLLVHTGTEAPLVAGTEPLLGRFLTAEDLSGRASGAVISHDLWQSEFGGADDVLGRSLSTEGTVHTVVGVMPKRFYFLGGDIWVAHTSDLESENGEERAYVVNVRLQPGADMDAVRPALAGISRSLVSNAPASLYPPGWALDGDLVIDAVMGPMRPAVTLLVAASVLMLLIALANVTTLINVRQAAMEPQLAIRLALGATSRSLLFDAFVSNLLLAAIGIGLGWALGGIAFDHIVGMISPDWIPRELEGQFRYVGASAQWAPVVALACAVIMTFSQWLRLRRLHPEAAMRGSTRSGTGRGVLRAISSLAALQVGAATLAGVLAGCIWLGSNDMRGRDLGLRPEGVLSARLQLRTADYPDVDARRVFADRLRADLEGKPGIAQAALADAIPFQRYRRHAVVSADAASGAVNASADLRSSFGPLHDVLGMSLLQGRFIDDARDDENAAAVAVVNQTLARRLWGSDDVIGRNLSLPPGVDGVILQRTVVGVLADARYGGALAELEPMLFIPHAQDPTPPTTLSLMVRGQDARTPDIKTIMQAAASLDPRVPLFDTVTLADRAEEALAGLALAEAVFLVFASLAGMLAFLGMAVVLQFLIAVRRREYAVRSAIGAPPSRLFQGVLGEGLRIGLPGIAAGIAASWLLASVVSANLHDATPWQPLAGIVTGVAVLLIVVLVTLPSARRAAASDPASVLRSD